MRSQRASSVRVDTPLVGDGDTAMADGDGDETRARALTECNFVMNMPGL